MEVGSPESGVSRCNVEKLEVGLSLVTFFNRKGRNESARDAKGYISRQTCLPVVSRQELKGKRTKKKVYLVYYQQLSTSNFQPLTSPPLLHPQHGDFFFGEVAPMAAWKSEFGYSGKHHTVELLYLVTKVFEDAAYDAVSA